MSNPIAKSERAGKTNKIPGSLVKCEVKLEGGEWITPESCAVYRIDADAYMPSIDFEIKTDEKGPFNWSWDITWPVMACPQRKDKPRFKPQHNKTYREGGQFTSSEKKWRANFNELVLGGCLTVRVNTGTSKFVRKVMIKGTEPGAEKVMAELAKYEKGYSGEARLAKKIFKQETNFLHFFTDEEPLVSFDNGFGLGQATNPPPSFEEVWNWKKHVDYIVTKVIHEKRQSAKKYLDKHGMYTDDDLDMETLVFYNGANYHYLVWDGKLGKWVRNDSVLCDPAESNKGWDMNETSNKGKTVEQLRHGDGEKPKYTGRCYAEHVKNNQ